MKNIALVIDSLTGGGAEKVMLNLAKGMVELGNKVTLLSLSDQCDYILPDNIDVHYLFQGKASKVDRFWSIGKSLKALEHWFDDVQSINGQFDLIFSNLNKSNNLLANSKLKNNKKLFFIIHNSIEEELIRQKKLGPFAYYYLVKSKALLSGKQLITVSFGIEKEISNGSRIQAASIQTIYNPFDFDEIQSLSIIENQDIPDDDYIIHVGRFARQKRHDVLFAAFKLLAGHYQLVLLCNNPKKALKLAEKYGITERLILPGFQSNPYNWIRKAKVLVLSSDYEGFGNVLVEALSVGTKVVSTRCPHGPDEILTGELERFLVPRRNDKALVNTIKRALETDVNCLEAQILQQVSAIKVAKQYLALCR
jgi:glycosyltransferase involved in cell wall biosynthesis